MGESELEFAGCARQARSTEWLGLALRSDGTIATSRYSLLPVRPGRAGLIALIVVAIIVVAALLAVVASRYRARLLARRAPH